MASYQQLAQLRRRVGKEKPHKDDEITEMVKLYSPRIEEASEGLWCAVHLKVLCSHYLRGMTIYGEYSLEQQKVRWAQVSPHLIGIVSNNSIDNLVKKRGGVIGYESLPGAFMRVILPLFGITTMSRTWYVNMLLQSRRYSKSGSGEGAEMNSGLRQAKRTGVFRGDAELKQKLANADVTDWAETVMIPMYRMLYQLMYDGYASILPKKEIELVPLVKPFDPVRSGLRNWTLFSTVPALRD